jgi:hypothetical protein
MGSGSAHSCMIIAGTIIRASGQELQAVTACAAVQTTETDSDGSGGDEALDTPSQRTVSDVFIEVVGAGG